MKNKWGLTGVLTRWETEATPLSTGAFECSLFLPPASTLPLSIGLDTVH